ncbi:ABC transporter ATP-binding protein [Chelatococcus asaccharovorans]|uniref:ABC transporter ATP-binding protein n=1 Tax=Chelatococcus asaccharovorans TaxID=28210 RepID=UPI00224C72AB|nr:ABC transporter ATP-binding protein [Chelatococcus asaccharovorans]CAH1661405.1 Spermidine/putrescine import ATP-binding protein PotA [Chelatococcus asaccharovorans]CAH1683483.1 Spermidine/putrescine import ATP-binding protein PotA [Chelatococcus asaccharovorans]
MNNQHSALTVSGLSKIYYGTTGGVQKAEFALENGTFFTLLGPSGCGKTTTLRCIAGLETPNTGAIRLGQTTFFDSATGEHIPLNRRNIGMVFQSYAIWPHLTVFENVAFPLRVGREKYAAAQVREMVERALSSVDLTGFEDRSATQLSGGQQQRVALARAIVKKPSLLLLDEPLSNLDALLRDEMRAELKALQGRLGVTTIYVTHDQAEALEMSDLIAVMNKGLIVQMGTPQDIYFRPANGFVASFMGSTNVLAATVDADVPEGAFGSVTLVGGRRIAARATRSLRAGEGIVVSIRPEDIGLAAAASGRASVNQMQGTVTAAGFLGHLIRYDIDVGGHILHASVGSHAVFERGATVSVEFAFDDALALVVDKNDNAADFARGRRNQVAA